jgi:hypothetical protein
VGQASFAGLNVVTMFVLVFAFQKMIRLNGPRARICCVAPSVLRSYTAVAQLERCSPLHEAHP